MKKTYKNVLPCGILQVGDRVYHLLSPSPVPAENWQHTEQQRFSVVPFNADASQNTGVISDDGEYIHEYVYGYGYARHLVCSNPIIEYRAISEPIKIETGYIDDGIEVEYDIVNPEDTGYIPDDDYFATADLEMEYAR